MRGFLFYTLNIFMGVLYSTARTGFINPVNDSVDKLIAASEGLVCLKNALLGIPLNPSMLLTGLAGVAAGMANAIVTSVTRVIYKRAAQIIDSVLSPIRQIEAIIKDITKTLIDIQNLVDKALNMDNYFKDRQQCADMATDIMNCLAQQAIDKVSAKIATKVDKEVGKIADNISKEAFKANGSISAFVNKQAAFLNKYSLQNKLL